MVFRGWDCFHSIRNEFLLRSWCSKKFPTYPKNIFSNDFLSKTYFWGIFGNFGNPYQNYKGNYTIPFIILVRISEISEKSPKNMFWIKKSIEKIFFGKVGNFFEHQDRSKNSLRIEWKHSQPLRTTLKHSSRRVILFLL